MNKDSAKKKSAQFKTADYVPEIKGLHQTLLIILLMWISIFSYSILISYITGCHWWEMIAHYFAILFIFYLWHWQAHQAIDWIPFNSECRRLHNEHHFKTYPPSKYFGKDVNKLEQTHESFFT
jgi:hypothetical protein